MNVARQCFRVLLFLAVCVLPSCFQGCTRHSAPPPAPALQSSTSSIATILDPQKAAASPQITRQPLRFTDVSAASGLQWRFSNGAFGKEKFIETTGGGVALFDYNDDGLLDIFAVQGGPIPGATGAETNFPAHSVLYRNNGDGTFTDVTAQSGLDVPMGCGQGVSVADYDNDGWPDLYVTSYGGNHLFHNRGNGTFEDVTAKAHVDDHTDIDGNSPWPLSSAWADYDNDGRLDLFVCHYCRWSPAINKECMNPLKQLAYCRPQVYEATVCRLYHNNGDGTFTDVTAKAGLDKLRGKSMSAAWLDFDDDGWMDLFVTNDTMVNFLLHNKRDGTFSEEGVLSGVAYGEQGAAASGMGIGVGDYNNDGREDLFVVNFSGQPKSAYENMGGGVFENRSAESRLASSNLQFLAFGLECADYDLDGYKDLLVGNGHVLDTKDAQNNSSTYEQSQQLFHNSGDGAFVEDLHSLGDLVKPRVTRGMAVGDVDNDGDLDVVMVSQTGPLQWFRNDGGNLNNWVTLRLEGVSCNRDAVGAKVTITTAQGKQTQWVRGGSSYCSHSDQRVTFGLGQQTIVNAIEVRWPGGKTEKAGPLPARAFYWWRQNGKPVPDPRVKAQKKL